MCERYNNSSIPPRLPILFASTPYGYNLVFHLNELNQPFIFTFVSSLIGLLRSNRYTSVGWQKEGQALTIREAGDAFDVMRETLVKTCASITCQRGNKYE
ncbi:retinaldehyde dehydrogenase 2 [Paenibacillus sp. NAIST15-1]|nr:retinaldehyde dehydrogenase 2 [Paenibacillus sp. NAIST15-1]